MPRSIASRCPPFRYRLKGRGGSAPSARRPSANQPLLFGKWYQASSGSYRSLPQAIRKNNLLGDTDWRKLEYEFSVQAGPDEVVLVAELRASAGEAWFDKDSLKLRKK